MTAEALELMPDDGNRYEVIEGEVFGSRAPDLSLQLVIVNLSVLIKGYLEMKPVGIVVPGLGVIFSKYRGVIPDLVFFTHETRGAIVTGGRLRGAPELAIEIISPGAENRRRDRVVKRNLYAKYGVEEYWIIAPKARLVEVYNLEETPSR